MEFDVTHATRASRRHLPCLLLAVRLRAARGGPARSCFLDLACMSGLWPLNGGGDMRF
jgi:hypothetical protein